MGRILLIGDSGGLDAALETSALLQGHEIERSTGNMEALHGLRDRAFDVALTDPTTSVAEDLAFVREVSGIRPGLRVIVLAPAASREDVIAALRAQVFACFTPPFQPYEIIDMVREALRAIEWRHGIEVVSGLPQWFTMRVSCHLLTAERLMRFMTEYQAALPNDERDQLMAAFREMLLNAMEYGAGFDAEKVIEVTAAKTDRAIVYHFRDPGAGFNREDLAHATRTPDPDEVIAVALRRAELGLRPGGFGMLIARQIADELVHNERGNEVLLIKYLTP